nr:MAG TPA: hypothetical protein [Caudoviricetes sp.]
MLISISRPVRTIQKISLYPCILNALWYNKSKLNSQLLTIKRMLCLSG